MAEQSRATLKAQFERKDKPTEQTFIDVFDSMYNIADDALFPSSSVYVDASFTDNEGDFYDNISDALTRCNAKIASGLSHVELVCKSDSNGDPIGLGTNDYYTLLDSGIQFVSPYDPMNRVLKGGEIVEADFLYELKESELNMEIQA